MHVALTTMDKESPEKPIISYGHSNRIAVDDWNGTALENIPTDLIPIIQNYWTIHRRLQGNALLSL